MLFINFCFQSLLKTSTDCCWIERQNQRDAWGFAHTACGARWCLHTTVCKWFGRNNGHLPLQIWTHIMSGKRCTNPFWKLHQKPNTVS